MQGYYTLLIILHNTIHTTLPALRACLLPLPHLPAPESRLPPRARASY